MKYIAAFILLCLVVLWSFIKGYKQWRQGRLIQALILTFIGAYAASLVVAKIGEWL